MAGRGTGGEAGDRPADLHARAHFVEQVRRDLAQEARRDAVHVLAVQAARLGIGQDQLLPGAGDAHVGQAPLLFQPAALVQRTVAGEQPLFQSGQEHQRELQALGRVQRHQLHAVLAGLHLAFAGLQRGVGQERDQLAHAFRRFVVVDASHEARGDRHQLVQVLGARFGIQAAAAFLRPVLAQARADQYVVHALGQVQFGGFARQLLDQRHERGQRVARTPRQSGALGGQHRRAPQRHARVPRETTHFVQRALADATCRRVDRALEGRIVAAVGHQAQVGQRVLDFGALEETHAAVDAVRQLFGQQRFFERA